MGRKAVRMKILLVGKNGQVGRELQRTLLPFGEVVAVGREQADIENVSALAELLEGQRPDIIVNAAAYTAVDKAESDQATAYRINAEAVGQMASYAKKHGAWLVHYSTDYVFDGEKDSPYLETDSTDPQSVYGRSKRAGELAILEAGCNALVFRTSWVFSAHGGNFIKTILRLAKEKASLNVVADQFGAPTSAELISDVTALAIAAAFRGELSSGIYHLTASGATNWHGLASYAVERASAHGIVLALKPTQIQPIPTEAYPLPATRPKNSRMSTQALSTALNLQLPPWQIHVDRMIDQLVRMGLV
jgi:dTDP-4-dehydrorhamnose reductase